MNRVGQLLAANVGGRPFAEGALFAQKFSLVLFVGIGMVPLAGWLSLTLLAAFTAASSLAFPKEQGIIADLQMTPLKEKRLIQTLAKLAVNRTMVFLPAFALAEWQFFIFTEEIIEEIPRGPYQVCGPAILLPVLLALGAARFGCVVMMSCAVGTSRGNPIWHAALATCAILWPCACAYSLLAAGLVGFGKGVQWGRPGLAVVVLVLAGAAAVCLMALFAARFYRVFGEGIRGGLRRHPLSPFQGAARRG